MVFTFYFTICYVKQLLYLSLHLRYQGSFTQSEISRILLLHLRYQRCVWMNKKLVHIWS
uniref:Uncharacterized protein n=1 Tax=Arundo donax TaxID=35708 RepID=A0A0A9B6K0_ARUDO